VTSTLTVTFDGATCRHDAPAALGPGIVRVVFVNTGDADALADLSTKGWVMVEVPANAGRTNSGYAKLDDGVYDVQCIAGFETTVAGPPLKVGS
jgi:hypothetical protein